MFRKLVQVIALCDEETKFVDSVRLFTAVNNLEMVPNKHGQNKISRKTVVPRS